MVGPLHYCIPNFNDKNVFGSWINEIEEMVCKCIQKVFPELSRGRESHGLPPAQRSLPSVDDPIEGDEQTPSHSKDSFRDPEDFSMEAGHQASICKSLERLSCGTSSHQQLLG